MQYPDMISEYTLAPERYEADGVQYTINLVPPEIAAGEMTTLELYLQSTLEVPVEFSIRVRPLLTKEAAKVGAQLQIKDAELKLTLSAAQVGRLVIPIASSISVPPGSYEIQSEVATRTQNRGRIVRPPKGEGRFKKDLIDDVVGLGLVAVLGADYRTKPGKKVSLSLPVKELLTGAERADMDWKFQSLWEIDDLKYQNKAQHEVNDRRVHILDELSQEALFAHLMAETQVRYQKTGLPLHLGEAIGIAKMLTYTAGYFLKDTQIQDGLLVPIFARAAEQDITTSEVLPVIRFAGYHHLTRLACAAGFGLIARALKRHPWSLEERRAVVELISTQVTTAQYLPEEFLYIPLLMGATQVADKVVLEGEDYRHSLKLLGEAKAARQHVFDEEEDLAEVGKSFDRLIAAASA